MNYDETLQFLYSQVPVFEHVGGSAYKPGLDNVRQMDLYFGQPHRRFKTIHVAGTNGKGSVSHTLAAILQSAGYKVGLFTSPHLLDFAERIRVDGQPIEHSYVQEWTAAHYENIRHIRPSFFELATMMGFCYFADRQVDVAVIEVGLGGRLDSTNIITPILSIITNISFDHTQFLGNTLPQIALEKAGIMKPGVPCVVGECYDNTEVRDTFIRHAQETGTPLALAEERPEMISATEQNGLFLYETESYGKLVGELTGFCQSKNTNTILAALRELEKSGMKISHAAIAKGFRHVTDITGLMGRWQKVGEQPDIYCDTGHNEGCFRYIAQQLQRLLAQNKQLHIVFGMVSDKDVDAVLRLLPKTARYYVTAAQTQRAMPPKELFAKMQALHLSGEAFPTVREALLAAQKQISLSREGTAEAVIFIGGSNFIVAEALKALSDNTGTITQAQRTCRSRNFPIIDDTESRPDRK